MTAIIDSRERAMIPLLPNFEVRTLEAGDYIIDNYIIERKTWQDYYNSIADNRIFNMYKMLNYQRLYPNATIILLLEGEPQSHNIRAVVEDNLAEFMPNFNAQIVKTANLEESANYLKSLTRQQSYCEYLWSWIAGYFATYQPVAVVEPIDDIKIQLMKTWAAIGTSGSQLAEYINTADPPYTTSLKILSSVNGISDYTAYSLLSQFSLKFIIDPANRDAVLAHRIQRISDIGKYYTLSEKKYNRMVEYVNHKI